MSQENKGIKTFTAAEDLEAYRRVKLSTGSGKNVEYADAGDAFVGITAHKVSSGESVSVNLKTPGKTFKVVAAGIISEGADFYGANDGKISTSVSGSVQGSVLEEATADGDIIEAVLV